MITKLELGLWMLSSLLIGAILDQSFFPPPPRVVTTPEYVFLPQEVRCDPTPLCK